jgi:hypothetical protein
VDFSDTIGTGDGTRDGVGDAGQSLYRILRGQSCARRLGVFGIWLVLLGFVLQSVQYWVELLDVAVR